MRNITIHTGAGGMDMFEEAFEKEVGITRIYMGRKVMRILKKKFPYIRKSHTGRYFRTNSSIQYVDTDKFSWKISDSDLERYKDIQKISEEIFGKSN